MFLPGNMKIYLTSFLVLISYHAALLIELKSYVLRRKRIVWNFMIFEEAEYLNQLYHFEISKLFPLEFLFIFYFASLLFFPWVKLKLLWPQRDLIILHCYLSDEKYAGSWVDFLFLRFPLNMPNYIIVAPFG